MLSRIVRGLGLVAVVGGLYALNQSGAFETALDSIKALGPWAKPAFVLLHVVSVLAFVPSVAPTFAAGVLFGVTWGLPLTLIGAGIGSLIAFTLGRTTARGWVERRFSHDPRFRALSDLSLQRGWKIIAIARLTPIFPFSIVNYAFGVTSMRASHYMWATILGTIPSNAVYVYLGKVAGEVSAAGVRGSERSPLEWALLALGLVATIVLALYLRRVAASVFEADSPGGG